MANPLVALPRLREKYPYHTALIPCLQAPPAHPYGEWRETAGTVGTVGTAKRENMTEE